MATFMESIDCSVHIEINGDDLAWRDGDLFFDGRRGDTLLGAAISPNAAGHGRDAFHFKSPLLIGLRLGWRFRIATLLRRNGHDEIGASLSVAADDFALNDPPG